MVSVNDQKFQVESITVASKYIDEINQLSKKTAIELRNQSDSNSLKLFLELIENLQLFIEFMGVTYDFYQKHYPSFENLKEEMKTVHMNLLSLLKGMVSSQEKNDIVMLCDLIEYELVDNLTRWKISIIPELKGLARPSKSPSSLVQEI